MAIIIKSQKNKLKDIRFSDWIKQVDLTEPKIITLLAFFVPGRYSSFTLSFTDGEHRIRKSFNQNNEEAKKELKEWYQKIQKGKGVALFEVKKTENGYILDFISMDGDKSYEYRKDINGSLILKRISERKEDIPF